MELRLEVVLSSSIKRKKPWPRFCWLGQEKESVFLLDDRRISEINMTSGRTKKKTPKIQTLLGTVVTMATSHNGMFLCGLLTSGDLFLWNRDKDLLKTAAAVPEVIHVISSAQGNPSRLCLQVSCDGVRVLLASVTGPLLLWECVEAKGLTGLQDGPVRGRWTLIKPPEDVCLPSLQDKEASQHGRFVQSEVMGDSCVSAFVFTSAKNLVITCVRLEWKGDGATARDGGLSVQWACRNYPLPRLSPPCQPVKSRGALVLSVSPDGQVLAVVLNQRKPKATQVVFVSTQNFVSVSTDLGGCGSKNVEIPAKYVRSYWVAAISWSLGSLFLACVLKRGSLLVLPRLGPLLTLTTSGCDINFGPAHFLPLHPLVTYRPPASAGNPDASLSSSSVSARDVLRQRFSVTWHPRLFYLIVSDGYMATVMRLPEKPSPALLLNTLLMDTSKDLQKVGRTLERSQPQLPVKTWLESVSCLNPDGGLDWFKPAAVRGPNVSKSVVSAAADGSALPPFLQEQRTLGGTSELMENLQSFFEDDSDFDGVPAGSHMQDRGHLEFASMFDTLHAPDSVVAPDYEDDSAGSEGRSPVLRELGQIQTRLLTAWAFAISLGNAVEHRIRLLRHTLCCVVHLAALLHLTSAPARLFRLIEALLSFLPWDGAQSGGPQCLGLMVEFGKRMTRLLLTPLPDPHGPVSSQTLSRAVVIVQMLSNSLDHTYCLQQRTDWSSPQEESAPLLPQLCGSDLHLVPMLQEEEEEESGLVHRGQPVPHRPSSRLLGVWRLLYNTAWRYTEELQAFRGCDGWKEEEQEVSVVLAQIQTALQAAGEKLNQGPHLLPHPGENLFLTGLYSKSADRFQLEISEKCKKTGGRVIFQQTRFCLGLLFSLLSQYQLREAQEFGDHMARLILNRAGLRKDSVVTDPPACSWLPSDLHSGAACAVVQSLGRFMASYFTNNPLFILPPHNVAILPPLHLPHSPTAERLISLSQEDVSRSVRQQHLSDVWTVDYAQDLLLIGGLLPEAVWLAHHLGDWKTAAAVSLAYSTYFRENTYVTRLRRKELHLPSDLEPGSIFQAQLDCLLTSKAESHHHADEDADRSFTEPIEGDDWDSLHISMQEILKASVMAGVDLISSPLISLLEKAKHLCSSFPALVPNELYLPSPPLYCPQPSPNTQDQISSAGVLVEVSYRLRVSAVLQRLLLLLRSARCCLPTAQFYVKQLSRVRHRLHKVLIRTRYSCPSAAAEEKTLPEGLMKFVGRGGFFRRRTAKDLDPDSIQTITCFRELCALCWMLHVRDQLSLHSRRYQAVRHAQTTADPDWISSCAETLRWAARLLPFSRFLGTDELLQDIVLSLVSELPPLSLAADVLVRAFPRGEESVRVPLREKYQRVLSRLRKSSVSGNSRDKSHRSTEKVAGNSNAPKKIRRRSEPMMDVIQDRYRRRRKHLARLQRHLTAPELHLWEKEEEEKIVLEQQPSLGTTMSSSSLTDVGFVPVCSDGDTAESTVTKQCHSLLFLSRGKKSSERETRRKTSAKIKRIPQSETDPAVGSWEFELEDDEYVNFLELFLTYVLGKDVADGGEANSSEPPLLKGFCSQIRDGELHSLTFDVLTTVHRRQRDDHRPNRKGSELQTSSETRSDFSFSSCPEATPGRSRGLFGLRQETKTVHSGQRPLLQGGVTDPVPVALPSESFTFISSVADVRRGLDPELEALFPDLGRLLEWMVRWADRQGRHGQKTKKKDADEGGVVIRVRASTPAVLTSLILLERRFVDLLGTDRHTAHVQVPESQWTVAPVVQPEVDGRPERDSSVDTGYPGSANTPITGLQTEDRSSDSPPEEPEEPISPAVQEPLVFEDQQSESAFSLCDLDVTPEKEVRSNVGEDLEMSSPGTVEGNTPETSLKLEDLKFSEQAEDSSSPSSLFAERPHPELSPPPPMVQTNTLGQTELPDLTETTVDPPNFIHKPPQVENTLWIPSMRECLGEDLFRLVQHINYMNLREVLGASFSNLQLAQQSVSFPQPNTNASQLSEPTDHIPDPKSRVLASAAAHRPREGPGPSQTPADRPVHQRPSSDLHHSRWTSPSRAGGATLNYQEMAPLSVQAEPQQMNVTENKEVHPFLPGPSGHCRLWSSSQYPRVQALPVVDYRMVLSSRCQTQLPGPLRRTFTPPQVLSPLYFLLLFPSAALMTGLRLLQLQPPPPCSSSRITLPKVSLQSCYRPEPEPTAIKLLHIDSTPRIGERREEKVKKTEVTFRPQESIIISTQEAADVPAGREDPAAAEDAVPHRDFTPPPGRLSPLLSGQRLLDKVMATSAELHAFASTQKKPPERSNAFTNTDTDAAPVLVDKCVSVQIPVMADRPTEQTSEVFNVWNRDAEEMPEQILTPGGHQFLSVLDLEENVVMRCDDAVPSVHGSPPSSAQLHVLALSVIRNSADLDPDPDPDPEPEPSVLIPEDLLRPQTQAGQSTCFRSKLRPRTSDEPADSCVANVDRAKDWELTRPFLRLPPTWFSSRLSELDAQLAALQNIADHLEKDFSQSRMLLTTIDAVTPSVTAEVKQRTAVVKKTVRLTLPGNGESSTARTHRPDPGPSLREDDDDDDDVGRSSFPRRLRAETPSLHTQTPAEPDNRRSNENMESAGSDEDAYVGQRELSDTAQLLEELVADGNLSPSDLEWTTSPRVHSSREQQQQEQQRRSWMSEDVSPQEEQKKEVRAWMRRRRREQLSAYHRHREELREQERRPFCSSAPQRSVNRRVKTTEEQKLKLLERYNQRTHEAFSLVGDFPDVSQTGSPLFSSASSAPPHSNTYSISKRSVKSPSGQIGPRLHQRSEVQESPGHRHRLGIHRPATSLPRDRLSQVTQRGMVSLSKSCGKEGGVQRRTGTCGSSLGGAAVGGRSFREEKEEKNQKESDMVLSEVLEPQQADGSGWDWLENVSGCSSLSQIDWAAVESIAADQED
ncbi:LOW QUALITY PROTEIN: ciliogenesis and planar polarity effector 1 [Pholidichthys leucotaenia]